MEVIWKKTREKIGQGKVCQEGWGWGEFEVWWSG